MHDWKAIMECYVHFKEDKSGREGGGVAFYVREQLKYIQLCLERRKSLWIRIKRRSNMCDSIVGAHYRLPDQEKEANEVFHRHLKEEFDKAFYKELCIAL